MMCLIGVSDGGSEHTTSTERDDAHAGSLSDAANVIVVRPTLLQVHVGPVVDALLIVPEVAVQLKPSGAGARSRSLAEPCSEIVPPKMTSAGLTSMPSIFGQMLIEPLIKMLPVVGCSSHVMWSATGLVAGPSMSNVAEPMHTALPSLLAPRIVIW